MLQRRSALFLIALCFSIASIGRSQSIAIGDVSAKPNAVARVPVNVSASTDTAALNLRLRYDPSAVTFERIDNGPLMTGAHQLFYLAPTSSPGKLNIVKGGIPLSDVDLHILLNILGLCHLFGS